MRTLGLRRHSCMLEIKFIQHGTSMTFTHYKTRYFLILSLIFLLSACGSSDDDDDDEGFVRLYNASENAPALFLSVEEDEDEDFDDEIEFTLLGVDYADATSRTGIPSGEYTVEIAWQDEDSTDREDLRVIFSDRVFVETDKTLFYVVDGDFTDPSISVFSIDLVDDEDDESDDLFNLQALNLSENYTQLDLWLSEEDETFEQAELIATLNADSLLENQKLAQDDYIAYLTLPGEEDPIFASSEIDYGFASQYLLIVRDNETIAATPLAIDSLTNGQVTNYNPEESQARIRFYNGIASNELVPDYAGRVDIQSTIVPLEGSENLSFSNLAFGQFTQANVVERGDFSVNVSASESGLELIKNQRVSLNENTDTTMFLYSREEYVDEDGDGNFDENGDGIIDEIRVVHNVVASENSNRNRLFDKQITMMHLADNEDFNRVTFYFVKDNEVIDTAENRLTVALATPSSLILRNNSYEVFAIAEIDGVETILDSAEITLDEETDDQYLLLETVQDSVSDFRISFVNQNVE